MFLIHFPLRSPLSSQLFVLLNKALGGGGNPGKHWVLKGVFHSSLKGNDPHSGSVVLWRGGAPLVNIFPQCFRVLTQWLLGFIVFFSDELTKPGVPCSFDRGLEPHSGFVNSHYRCLFCEGEGGGELLVNMGLLKSISSSFWRGVTRMVVPWRIYWGIDPHRAYMSD